MCVNNVMKCVIKKWSKGTIDSAKSTTQPIPLLVSEVRHKYIGVLEVCDQNQVIVHDHVRNQIKGPNSRKAYKTNMLSAHVTTINNTRSTQLTKSVNSKS